MNSQIHLSCTDSTPYLHPGGSLNDRDAPLRAWWDRLTRADRDAITRHVYSALPSALAARMLASATDVEIVIATHTTAGTSWYLSREAANYVVVYGRRQSV